jgi:hypothetical protein
MIPFDPLFRNPHLQTIAGHLWVRRGEEARYPLQRRLYRTEPAVEVLVQSQHPGRPPAGEIIMVHGLEGSGEAGYIRSLSGAALRSGYAAHRFHMRTCGGTERLAPTLYHAGLTGDLLSVLREFAREGRGPVFLIGFSLGGNVVLKLAGELAETAFPLLAGVCSVSAPLDLAACARRLADRENQLYERRFVRHMHTRLRATGRYGTADLSKLRTVMAIDDHITAPSFGFGTAAHYYDTQSAKQYLRSIRIPALLIHARDDTLVPFSSISSHIAGTNPCLNLQACDHGGHLGFLGRRPYRFWADHAIMEWIRRQGNMAP